MWYMVTMPSSSGPWANCEVSITHDPPAMPRITSRSVQPLVMWPSHSPARDLKFSYARCAGVDGAVVGAATDAVTSRRTQQSVIDRIGWLLFPFVAAILAIVR